MTQSEAKHSITICCCVGGSACLSLANQGCLKAVSFLPPTIKCRLSWSDVWMRIDNRVDRMGLLVAKGFEIRSETPILSAFRG
jgi:hypothetical protein